MQIKINKLQKKFNRNVVIKPVTAIINSCNSTAITGPNGAGKSTLLQIMAKIQSPTKGTVSFFNNNGTQISDEKIHDHIGFVSPLVNPYKELSALENIYFIKKSSPNSDKINELLEFYDLYKHRNKLIKHYSTGMNQRLKLICAFCNNPEILMLDEPSSNLDESGKRKLLNYLNSVRGNKIIIIATNDKEETAFCDEVINLG